MIKNKMSEILMFILDKLTEPPAPSYEESEEISEQEYIDNVALTIEDAYLGLPGFKSASPEKDHVCVYLTDKTLFNFFPRRFMDIPIVFVYNGEKQSGDTFHA